MLYTFNETLYVDFPATESSATKSLCPLHDNLLESGVSSSTNIWYISTGQLKFNLTTNKTNLLSLV
jgi:hypothetical protein